jgi:long-subunit acyl-CoA synthetase (AMP-forming)
MPGGEARELMYKGPMVMTGHHGDPRVTAETIRSDGWPQTVVIAIMDWDY